MHKAISVQSTVFLALLLAGCTRDEATVATGSSTLAMRGDTLWSVNAWDGTVVRTNVQTRDSEEIAVGGEPTRIALVGDEVWVTLRAERSVLVLGEDGEERERVAVGAEPHGIVASPDGERVYVALSQGDEVAEFDAETREQLRSWMVHDDPRWLAMHPSGRALYVTYAFEAGLTRIDLRSGEQTDHRAPSTHVPTQLDTDLHGRATGDPAISPRGDALVSPTLYSDSDTIGPQPLLVGSEIIAPAVPYYVGDTSFGAGYLQLPVSRFNPALVAFPLDTKDGRVLDGQENEETLAVFVGGYEPKGPVRGYIASATFDPDGVHVYATLEASDAVAMVDLRPVKGQGNARSVFGDGSPIAGLPAPAGFYERAQVFVRTGENPSGLALAPEGQIWVHERGERALSSFAPESLLGTLQDVTLNKYVYKGFDTTERMRAGESKLDLSVESGRSMFFSAKNGVITTPGAGVSCNTCHMDGRNDGLTWAFDGEPRLQTPSLAGPISETLPMTWTDNVPTVADEAVITAIGRMGGVGIAHVEAEDVAAFIDWTREVDVSLRGSTDPLVVLGKELFESEAVGCTECHSGPHLTDNLTHILPVALIGGGYEVNTPSLVGIAATAPYLHDGSSATLRDLLERVRDGSMGSTEGLSEGEMDALEAYLGSL